MPLVHPSTTPKQPRRESRDYNDDVGDVGVVLRQPSGQAGREDQAQEDGAQDQVEEGAGGYWGWYRHGGINGVVGDGRGVGLFSEKYLVCR